jgi:hypothetical protein
MEVKWPFFFRSRSFAAERNEPELILAIYVVSASSSLRELSHGTFHFISAAFCAKKTRNWLA